MERMSEKVAYLKGLAEGLNVDAQSDQGKLTMAILGALEAFAAQCDAQEERLDELEQFVGEIDQDVEELECALFDEDGDELDEDEDEDDDGDDGMIEYECPHCGTVVFFDEEAFDMEEEHLCPNCHRKIFAEDDEDGGDDGDGE